MKTTRIAAVLMAVTLVFSAGNALAVRKSTTVQGILGTSSQGKSMLKETQESDEGYTFDPASEAGKKILSICKPGKMCVVRGVIRNNIILNAYYVKIEE